jgi:hypothetical protein
VNLLLRLKSSYYYSKLLTEDTCPIDRLSTRKICDGLGPDYFESIVYLKPEFRYGFPNDLTIYSNSDGGGTAPSKSEACNKGISEALERWAFYKTCSAEFYRCDLGFSVDRSTTGFACTPGKNSDMAKDSARTEAIERNMLQLFCTGLLGLEHKKTYFVKAGKIEILRFRGPFKKALFIASHQNNTNNLWVYGFSAGNEKNAISELRRNLTSLKLWLSSGSIASPNITERRLVFFSSKDGEKIYRDLVLKNKINSPMPAVPFCIDKKIEGPWSPYCSIWRALIPPLKINIGSEDEKIFYF